MDSDDNDFRNQNFGLAGEDNNRFPHTLQTFSLPKFNFDDHLQVQLRFDSLAGPDSLLSMQGEEDNWIEEFSPRHGAIEFSSDAAESCSITRHNNIWFEATSSESVEMLLKSVGDDDMMNKKLVNKDTNKLTTTEYGCIIEDNVHNDPVGSNEDVAVQLQSVGTSQGTEVEKLEDKTNLNLDEKLHIPTERTPEKGSSCENLKPSSDKQFLEAIQSDYSLNDASIVNDMGDDSIYSAGRTNKLGPLLLASCTEDAPSLVSTNNLVIVPQQSTDSENLKPPSAGTKCSSADEFLEVFQSDNSLHNASMSKGLARKFDCPAQKNNEASPMLLTFRPDAFSFLHTNNMSIVGEEKKFKRIVEECSDIGVEHESENLQPYDRTKGSCRKISIKNELGHGHVEDSALSKDACNMTYSSNIEPSSVALTLLNSSGFDSASSKNCIGSLDTIASHVKLADNDSESDDKSIPLSEKMPSAAIERRKGVVGESFEVDNKDPIQKSPHDTVLTEHTRALSFEEEPGNSKSAMADGQEAQLCNKSCREMISSCEVLVDQQSLALTINEGQLNEAEDGGCGKTDTSVTLIPDSAAREKAAEYDLEEIVEKSPGGFGGSQCSDVEKSSLVNDVGQSVQISETSNLGKSNEDKTIYVEPSSCGKVVTNPSLDLCCASANINSFVVVEKEIDASEAQDSSFLKADRAVEELHVGEAVRDLTSVSVKSSSLGNLRVLQQSQPKDLPYTLGVAEVAEVKEVAEGSFLPASDCIKDSNTYLPAEKNDSVNLTQHAALSNTALCSLAPSNSVEKNGEHAGLDKACIRATESLLRTSGGMDQGKDAQLALDDISNRENVVQTSSGPLNISTDHPSVVSMPKSNAECTNSLEFESDNQNSSEAKCGSPAFISCNESVAEHPKGEGQLPISSAPASETASIHRGKCAIGDHNQSTMSEDDESFTFEIQLVRDPSHKDTGNDWKPFSDMHSSETPQASAENPEAGEKNSQVRDKLSDISNAGYKKKQASSLSTRKVGSSKSNTKGKSQQKQAKGGREKKSSFSPGLDSPVKSKTEKDVIQEYPCLDSSTSKSTNSADINVSVSSAASFNQPFTDLQQVQLRAQIFVYGSLIQGVPPDEACILSAFGGTDGGRSLWEGPVRAAFERLSLQKSPFSTPVHTRLGVSATEQASHPSSLHSKALKFPSGQNSNKIVPSVSVNASGYWPSPFWSKTPNDGLPSSIPRGSHLEFNQSVSPLHAYQSLQSRPGTSNESPWLSQSSRPPLWGFPPQNSPVDAGAQYSAITASETIPVPTRDYSVSRAANAPLTSLLPDQGPGNISTSLELHEALEKNLASPVSSKNEPAGHKSRRKKKVSSSQVIGPAFSVSQTQPDCTQKQISSPAISSLPAVTPTAATSCLVSTTSHSLFPANVQITDNSDVQERTSSQVEMLTGIEQSKIQAENAASEAAAAVKHSQDTWNQLASQRESGLVSEVEKKLVSAAVAAAAAVSVSKAAAAAAKLALGAAIQAKMMADDALAIEKTVSAIQHTEGSSIAGKSLGWLSPTTIMKTKDKVNGSNSIISAAREASRKRVEAASFATKRAENLDAILKAAEQALEAVSHAGTIISMGDPLPFSMHELVEAGPNGYWKVNQANNRAAKERKYMQAEEVLVCDHESDESQHNEQLSNQKQKQKVADVHRIYTNIESSEQSEENDAGKDLENASIIVPTDMLSKDSSGGSRCETGIKKGSLVEVAAMEDGLRGAWFSAWILDLKDGKAYVCYKDLLCDEGHDQLKEWIPLESDDDRAPRIRVAHPLTITKYEGTRKRRREAVGNHAWDVGDKVDVWLRDGWWEGIVTEKSLEDITKLTVHFPAGGDSSFVKTWNLRPSLVWKDGQWVEWTRDRHADTHDTNQADTPYEKRRKTSQHETQCVTDTEERAIVLTKNDQSGLTKVVESSTLNLSEKDKIFCMGGNVKEKDDTLSNRIQRTGFQKEGSRVIFGVPKPGKKRKFMEVSKHYTSEMTGKVDEVNYSSKFTKSLIPKASHSWRESSRVNPKGKLTGSKNTTSKPSRPLNVYSRSSLEKGNPPNASMPAVLDAERSTKNLGDPKTSSKEDDNTGRKTKLAEGVSYSSIPVKVNAPGPESRLPPVPVNSYLKKKNTSMAEQTSGNGKNLPAMDDFTRSEDQISEDATDTAADVVEPRRSRRRIQPTSRLLEGLQSSLIMSKIPSVSHDKCAKGLRRGASSTQGGHGHR